MKQQPYFAAPILTLAALTELAASMNEHALPRLIVGAPWHNANSIYEAAEPVVHAGRKYNVLWMGREALQKLEVYARQGSELLVPNTGEERDPFRIMGIEVEQWLSRGDHVALFCLTSAITDPGYTGFPCTNCGRTRVFVRKDGRQ